MSANIYFLARAWTEKLKINIELHNWKVFQPQLTLHLKEGLRPLEDWYEEAFTENVVDNPECFVPDGLELCEEPVWLEVIGTFDVIGSTDYYGEYDEEISFDIIKWTVEVEDNQIEETIMSVRIKTIKIYCCEDCPALGDDNICDELERIIEEPSSLEMPEDCPLEEL